MSVAKRLLDIGLASFGLAVATPVMAIAAAAIRLETPGAAVFRQQRVGRNFRPFEILKLRTMTNGAGRRGPAVTTGGDARVTRVGKVLRATKLDELPQLWNVLRGDMSLVGPRPEVSTYVEAFRSDYAEILSVRPGITDLASLKFRREEEILRAYADPEAAYIREILPAKIRLAKEYVAAATIALDLQILWRTALSVLLD